MKKIEHYKNFPSEFIPSRNIEVWLPPGYSPEGKARYPVLYLHDGQNLFYSATSYTGVTWGLHTAMCRLLDEGKIAPAILVGIWNTANRAGEYCPQAPIEAAGKKAWAEEWFIKNFSLDAPPEFNGDAYLKFIVQELKPFIDQEYAAYPEQEHTFIMGSSMGGLISLYALQQYPEVFYGAACLSMAWAPLEGLLLEFFEQNIPDPAKHKLYFDQGDDELDRLFTPFQIRFDRTLHAAGYRPMENWMSQIFEGHQHNESSWRERIHIPLEFLFGKNQI